VETVDGKKISAKVVGKDVFSSTILLKLEKKALKPIKRTKNCELGDWAALVGLFYNRFPAIYHGFVGSVSDEELLLNAPVVPGSLGGAVVNKKGELMGIIRGRFGYTRGPNYTYKDHSSEISIRSSRGGQKDMCLAVPSAKIDSIARDLEKYGKVRKGWLGVNLNAGKKGSDVCVGNVVKNSPAHIAGLRKGDVILKIKNEIIRTPSSVSKVIKDLKP
ncbi:MAG: serine protease, partial [bacterium]|nr:serine protease [bacterium]